jgi:hypothetical protein
MQQNTRLGFQGCGMVNTERDTFSSTSWDCWRISLSASGCEPKILHHSRCVEHELSVPRLRFTHKGGSRRYTRQQRQAITTGLLRRLTAFSSRDCNMVCHLYDLYFLGKNQLSNLSQTALYSGYYSIYTKYGYSMQHPKNLLSTPA